MAPRTTEGDDGPLKLAESGELEADELTPLFGSGEPGKTNDEPSRAKSKIGIIAVFGILCGSLLCLLGVLHQKKGAGPYRIDWDGEIGPLFSGSPEDLGLQGVHREMDASPSSIWGNKGKVGPLPTNSWYLVSIFLETTMNLTI